MTPTAPAQSQVQSPAAGAPATPASPTAPASPAAPEPHAAYVEAFAAGQWAQRGPGFVREARRQAMAAFARAGFPSTRDEAWRHTSVRELARTRCLPLASPARPVGEAEVAPYRIPGAVEVVLVDGHFVSGLSSPLGPAHLPDGLRVQAMSAALLRPGEALEAHLARHAGDAPFVALNTAFFQDGLFMDVAPGARVEAPVHLLHLSTGPATPAASHVRNLVLAGAGAQATLVESYAGLPSGAPGLTTAVTELVAGRGAHAGRVKLQREELHTFHVGHLAVRQDRDSTVRDLLFSVGAALARNEIDAVLGDEGAEVVLSGLFLASGRQHVDCPTRVEHARPHTTSRELYKGVLDGAAHGVFLGNVKVLAGAAQAVSQQTNRNLLLSPQAAIDTTPQLEIHNDDVQCSHGSTIGQLSKDALFFLRSRGIGEEAARLLLTQAFAREVLEKAPPALRPTLDGLLAQWFACRKVQGAMA